MALRCHQSWYLENGRIKRVMEEPGFCQQRKRPMLSQRHGQVAEIHLLGRLIKNVQMQGIRNRGPAQRVGSPLLLRTNSEE
jgi:hypothetical protein